jgi:hypothetical protein
MTRVIGKYHCKVWILNVNFFLLSALHFGGLNRLIGPAGRKLRSDVIVPLKRQMRSILAVIDVFRSRFLPSGIPDNAGVIPFLTSR